ncbi:MAG: gspK 1, partial [Firmicutes bacterium]|nr:gspK 1 [Bacillota bacterium]
LAKKQPLPINCVVLGLAGLDTKKDEMALTSIVKQALADAKITADAIHLCNDAMLTLKGSIGRNNGVLLAAGTGSIACGITKEGQETRVGGWGHLVGDEGSGYSIGKAAITQALKSYDGREKSSGLPAAILQELSCANAEELVQWVYSSRFSVAQVAALTPSIVRLAEGGDEQAETIIGDACQELENMAYTVIKKLDLLTVDFSLILTGGVLKNQFVRRQLMKQLTDTRPGLQALDPNCPPICAGLRYGLMLMGIDHEPLLRQLTAQLQVFPFAEPAGN